MFHIKQEAPFVAEEECMIVGLFDRPEKFSGPLEELDKICQGRLTELVKEGDLSAKFGSCSVIFSLDACRIKRLVFIGLGREDELTANRLKQAFGVGCKKLEGIRVQSLAVALDSCLTESVSREMAIHVVSEAFSLATYEFQGYKRQSNEPEARIQSVSLYTEESGDAEQIALNRAIAVAEGTNYARDLVNLPGNLLKAHDLVCEAEKLAEKHSFEIEVLSKDQMQKLGMGALLAVNQGSEEPPFMIVLKYKGNEKEKNLLGIIGKGVTFDTGGYSVKPKDGLAGMKTDMAGAAAALGSMDAIGKLRPKNNIMAVIPATDNMISGGAFKPDDVITSLNGKTIEVLNTDAEGRLVLADAITYAKMHGATHLIDVASLTGGVIVALGRKRSGVMTNSQEFLSDFFDAANRAGEPVWQLPYEEEDKVRVRSSKAADLNNSPGREGHAIMGGAFLAEFAEETPWIHVDIAGSAVNDQDEALAPAGPTGVMVRTLALFAEQFYSRDRTD